MEGVLDMQIFSSINAGLGIISKDVRKQHKFYPLVSRIRPEPGELSCSRFHGLTSSTRQRRTYASKICAVRRRKRADLSTGTYVLLEPGEDEVFVTEEELRNRLKNWLENWPGKSLPPDISRFESTEEAVEFLVNFVCELEIDGDVGSIQWYQVRLE